jgi:hypothetical protein
MKEPVSRERSQVVLIAAVSIGMVGLTALLQASNPLLFPRFIGSIPPVFAFLLVAALAIGLLSWLLSRGWFAICRPGRARWLWRPWGLAVCLASIAIVLDLKVGFPADLNVAFPTSLLFYPAIGFLVEVLFHVLPLTAMLIGLTTIAPGIEHQKATTIGVLVVAVLEPIYQTALMVTSPHYPAWAVIVVGLNLWAFNLLQLFTFRRYDFMAMYSLRLVYYLAWHVVWGYIRLRLLF